MSDVAELSQGRVRPKIGSPYKVLDRLAREGRIERDREEAHHGRLRHYYRLPWDGRRVAGRIWAIPFRCGHAHGQFQVLLPSRKQALQLQRMLAPTG